MSRVRVPLQCFVMLVGFVTVLAAGPAVDVIIKDWSTNRPALHDVALAPDGGVWYTASSSNLVGRFDPATQAIREYPLATPDHGPHGLTVDKDGTPWFTAYRLAKIGKIDRRTGQITYYEIPIPKATPHSIAVGPTGTVFFTVSGANHIGALDPATGRMTVVPVPTPKATPHGLAADSKGIVYFSESAAPKIGRLDPATMKITEFALPDPGTTLRKVAIAKDDTVWYTDWSRGYLGHLDPKTGKTEEYPSPGGSKSIPWAMAITSDGAVWYVETGDPKKNMLVRFEPASKQMQTWPVPGGAGDPRVMVVGKGDVLWFGEGTVGRVARVQSTSQKSQ